MVASGAALLIVVIWAESEPCAGFFGQSVPGEWHASRARFFQFAAREAGLPADTPVRFVDGEEAHAMTEDVVFIDWNVLAGPGT